MDDNTLTLEPVPQTEQVPLSTPPSPTPAPQIAQARASKADIGLFHVTGKSMPQVYRSIMDGEEDNYRSAAASAIDVQHMDAVQKNLSALAIQKGSLLTLQEVQDAQNVPVQNPDSVIEEAYANKYLEQSKVAAARLNSDILSDADMENPDRLSEYFSKGSDALARREYALKRAQDLDGEARNEAFFSIPVPQSLKDTFPNGIEVGNKSSPYLWGLNLLTGVPDELYSRGNTPGVGKFSGLQGTNVKAQAEEILTQPTFEQSKKMLDDAIAKIKPYSAAAAQDFAASVAGMSQDEIYTRNFMTPLNIVGAGGAARTTFDILKWAGGKTAKMVGRGVPPRGPAPTDASEGLTKGVDSVYRPAAESEAMSTARQAVEDVLNSSPASPTKANIAEAVGDTREAAVQKATVSTISPNPTKDAEDVLMSLHRADTKAIAAQPGQLSRENHVRLIDDADGFDKNLITVIKDTSKVDTLPQVVEQGFQGISDKISQYFKGREMTISDIDAKYNPLTNTWDHTVYLTNYNGERWTSRKLAENHIAINGYGGARVVGKDIDTVYLPPEAVFRNEFTDQFKTSKGSVYTVYPDGTTERYKKVDNTSHRRSDKTGYITPTEYEAYKKADKRATHVDKNGIHLFTDTENGAFITARKEPKIGLMPVEMLPNNKIHFGHPITEHIEGPVKKVLNPAFEIQSKNGVHKFVVSEPDRLNKGKFIENEVVPTIKPTAGYVPFDIKTAKFGEPVTGETAAVVQQGLGFHIEWTVPLDQTQSFVRDALIGTRTASIGSKLNPKNNGKFSDIANATLGIPHLRLPNDTLSIAEAENRAKVVYSQNRFLNMLHSEMVHVQRLYQGALDEGSFPKRTSLQYFGNLTGRNAEVWNDFKRALVVAQKAPDPVTKLPGYYMQTPAEIQAFWQNTFQRPASFAEQRAYLAMSRLNKADLVFRNIAEYRNKSRLGVMQHTISFTNEMGEKITSVPIEGRMLTNIKGGRGAAVIVDEAGNTRLHQSMNTKDQQAFKGEFEKGKYRGIQLYDPEKRPYKYLDKEGNQVKVEYIFAKNMESSQLSYNQVGYRGGGHWDYAYENYFKQPIVRKQIIGGKTQWIYEGDQTFSPGFKTMAESKQFLTKLNEVIGHMRNKDMVKAKAAHISYSDMEWKDFVKGFYAKKGEQPTFNLEHDFHVVPNGRTVKEMVPEFSAKFGVGKKFKYNGEFIDGTRSGSLARNFRVDYTGTRDSYDLFAPENIGSRANPHYKFQPAELTDPVATMQRSLDRIVNSFYADDYKWAAVEHWNQENGHLLNATQDQIRGDPYWHFMSGDMTRLNKNSLVGRIAEDNRYKIKKLLGMPSEWDNHMHTLKQEMADFLYDSHGVKRAALLVPNWMLAHVSKPVQFVTAMAFHETLGLFSWVQLAAQQTAWLNFYSQAPGHAFAGSYGAWMHLWSMLNGKPNILAHLGKMAEGMFWNPGEFEKARMHYQNVGFDKVGKSMVFDPSAGKPKSNFMMTGAKRLLNNATLFFEMAEQNVRHGAWYTAYHEFVRAYPNRAIGQAEEGMILNRANNMYGNMGRDSKTILSEGAFRMPLQFFKYIENTGQFFLGKRIGDVFGKENTVGLRAKNRATMYLAYALAFGPAGATGLTLLPFGDIWRRHEIENGYVPGMDFKRTLINEGPLSMAGAYLSGFWRTGNWDMSKGTFYNFNDRYGANGLQVFRDLLEPSSSYWKILLGAGGSTFANNVASLSGFTHAIYSAYMDTKDNPWPLTMHDWAEPLRNVNSFSQGEKFIYAMQFGKWLDRHGRPTEDIGRIDAIFRTLMGVTDQKSDDMYLMNQSQEERKRQYGKAAQEYYEQRRLADEAAGNKDYDMANVYNKRALFALEYRFVPQEEAAKIFAGDASRNKNLIDKVRDSYYLKLVPKDKIQDMQKAYQYLYQQGMPNP